MGILLLSQIALLINTSIQSIVGAFTYYYDFIISTTKTFASSSKAFTTLIILFLIAQGFVVYGPLILQRVDQTYTQYIQPNAMMYGLPVANGLQVFYSESICWTNFASTFFTDVVIDSTIQIWSCKFIRWKDLFVSFFYIVQETLLVVFDWMASGFSEPFQFENIFLRVRIFIELASDFSLCLCNGLKDLWLYFTRVLISTHLGKFLSDLINAFISVLKLFFQLLFYILIGEEFACNSVSCANSIPPDLNPTFNYLSNASVQLGKFLDKSINLAFVTIFYDLKIIPTESGTYFPPIFTMLGYVLSTILYLIEILLNILTHFNLVINQNTQYLRFVSFEPAYNSSMQAIRYLKLVFDSFGITPVDYIGCGIGDLLEAAVTIIKYTLDVLLRLTYSYDNLPGLFNYIENDVPYDFILQKVENATICFDKIIIDIDADIGEALKMFIIGTEELIVFLIKLFVHIGHTIAGGYGGSLQDLGFYLSNNVISQLESVFLYYKSSVGYFCSVILSFNPCVFISDAPPSSTAVPFPVSVKQLEKTQLVTDPGFQYITQITFGVTSPLTLINPFQALATFIFWSTILILHVANNILQAIFLLVGGILSGNSVIGILQSLINVDSFSAPLNVYNFIVPQFLLVSQSISILFASILVPVILGNPVGFCYTPPSGFQSLIESIAYVPYAVLVEVGLLLQFVWLIEYIVTQIIVLVVAPSDSPGAKTLAETIIDAFIIISYESTIGWLVTIVYSFIYLVNNIVSYFLTTSVNNVFSVFYCLVEIFGIPNILPSCSQCLHSSCFGFYLPNIMTILVTIVNVFIEALAYIIELFINPLGFLDAVWSDIENFVETYVLAPVFEAINAVESFFNNIISGIQSAISSIKSTINTIKNDINKVGNGIKSGWDKFKSLFKRDGIPQIRNGVHFSNSAKLVALLSLVIDMKTIIKSPNDHTTRFAKLIYNDSMLHTQIRDLTSNKIHPLTLQWFHALTSKESKGNPRNTSHIYTRTSGSSNSPQAQSCHKYLNMLSTLNEDTSTPNAIKEILSEYVTEKLTDCQDQLTFEGHIANILSLNNILFNMSSIPLINLSPSKLHTYMTTLGKTMLSPLLYYSFKTHMKQTNATYLPFQWIVSFLTEFLYEDTDLNLTQYDNFTQNVILQSGMSYLILNISQQQNITQWLYYLYKIDRWTTYCHEQLTYVCDNYTLFLGYILHSIEVTHSHTVESVNLTQFLEIENVTLWLMNDSNIYPNGTIKNMALMEEVNIQYINITRIMNNESLVIEFPTQRRGIEHTQSVDPRFNEIYEKNRINTTYDFVYRLLHIGNYIAFSTKERKVKTLTQAFIDFFSNDTQSAELTKKLKTNTTVTKDSISHLPPIYRKIDLRKTKIAATLYKLYVYATEKRQWHRNRRLTHTTQPFIPSYMTTRSIRTPSPSLKRQAPTSLCEEPSSDYCLQCFLAQEIFDILFNGIYLCFVYSNEATSLNEFLNPSLNVSYSKHTLPQLLPTANTLQSEGYYFSKTIPDFLIGPFNYLENVFNINITMDVDRFFSFFLNTDPTNQHGLLYWLLQFVRCTDADVNCVINTYGLGIVEGLKFAFLLSVAFFVASYFIANVSFFVSILTTPMIFVVIWICTSYFISPLCFVPTPFPKLPSCLGSDIYALYVNTFSPPCISWNTFLPDITNNTCPTSSTNYQRPFVNWLNSPYTYTSPFRPVAYAIYTFFPDVYNFLNTTNFIVFNWIREFPYIRPYFYFNETIIDTNPTFRSVFYLNIVYGITGVTLIGMTMYLATKSFIPLLFLVLPVFNFVFLVFLFVVYIVVVLVIRR